MAALVLSIAGAAAGSAVLGPVGAIVGRLVGAVAGNVIDQALFGARRNLSLEGPRLSDLTIMASTEGAAVPRVYALLNVRFGSLADNPSGAEIHRCPLWSKSRQARAWLDCPISANSRHFSPRPRGLQLSSRATTDTSWPFSRR
jgi:hypothetical protein